MFANCDVTITVVWKTGTDADSVSMNGDYRLFVMQLHWRYTTGAWNASSQQRTATNNYEAKLKRSKHPSSNQSLTSNAGPWPHGVYSGAMTPQHFLLSNFVVPKKYLFQTYKKNKSLAPLKRISPQTLKSSNGLDPTGSAVTCAPEKQLLLWTCIPIKGSFSLGNKFFFAQCSQVAPTRSAEGKYYHRRTQSAATSRPAEVASTLCQ